MEAEVHQEAYISGYKLNELDPDSDYCKGLPENVRRVLGLTYARQGSKEWLHDRMHKYIVSGTTGHKIISTPASRKAAIRTHMAWERPFAGNADTERGKANEHHGIDRLSKKLGVRIFELGTVPVQGHSFVGVSPDGITEDGFAVEIKCPRKINNTIKPEYQFQLQMEMVALGTAKAYFVQYQMPSATSGEVVDIREVPAVPGWFSRHLPAFRDYCNEISLLRLQDPDWAERYVQWTEFAKNPKDKPLPDIVQAFLEKRNQQAVSAAMLQDDDNNDGTCVSDVSPPQQRPRLEDVSSSMLCED